jgi:iron complex transport system substrate-binding protein
MRRARERGGARLQRRGVPPTRRLRALAATLAVAALCAVVSPPLAAAAAPSRVVALTPFTANTLAILGIRPVAIGQTLGGNEHYSRKLNGVKRLPLSHPNGPNMEQLAVLNPQLVLSTPTWKKGEQTMRQLKIRVVDSDPQRVADVPRETKRIGALVGRAKQAARLAAQQTAHIAAAVRAAKRHPSVLVVLGVGRTPFAFLANSWGGDVVKQAGGKLITAGLSASGGFAKISDEAVVKANPDVIIAVPHGNPGDLPGIADYLASNPAWKGTRAARRHHIYISTDNSLLEPWTSVAQTIYTVQTTFLKNR